MRFAKIAVVGLIWIASLVAATAWAHAQAQVFPLPAQPFDVISGADLGFRVDSWSGNVPVGRWVVRHPNTRNLWIEPKLRVGDQRLATR